MQESFGYWPGVKGGEPRKRFRFGSYAAVVLSDFEPSDDDEIKYLYVMAVFELPEGKLCLCVASEQSQELLALWERHPEFNPGGNAHVLGLFDGGGHSNLGTSSDWADLEKFTAKALDVARSHLKDDSPVNEVAFSDEGQ